MKLTRNITIQSLSLVLLLFAAAALLPQSALSARRPPNFVIIFADDLGYSDVGSFGARGYVTPHLDQMAREGVRLTNFYVAQAVCSASRAALLTGCYPNRVGIRGALDHTATHGLADAEQTIAEILRPRGYATAIFGKWHLGHHPQFLPVRHGFDEYFGLPYSNDMWPNHPISKNYYPDLPLIEQDKVIRLDPDQSQLTTWYTERAVSFIERNRGKPFFLYVPHSMPHVPLFVSDKFRGTTARGLYGDVISEIDWSVGQILAALKRHQLADDTLVIFTSDNGPWWEYGDHAGMKGALRGYKGTAFEGGVRVPFIARWPKRIPAGPAIDRPAMTIDLLPTIARLAEAKLPQDQIIDGRDIWPLLAGRKNARDPHDALYFYYDGGLHAARSGRWKLHLPHPYRDVPEQGSGGKPGKALEGRIELSLFDLENDPGESRNVAAEHPDVVQRLMSFVERARADLGDALTRREGKNVRPAGRLHETGK
jgi:arylsulfatase A-like enzyme